MAFLFSGLLGHPFRTTLAVGKFLAFTHLFIEYGYSAAPAEGPSMMPTVDIIGEWLLISRRHRHGRGIEVGDVVEYNIPINDTFGVKRVLGLPGDYVLLNAPGVGSDNMIQVNKNAAGLGALHSLPAHNARPGASRPLLDCRGQPAGVPGLENVWADPAGLDQGQGHWEDKTI